MIEVKLLGEFADVFSGYPVKSEERVSDGDYLLIRGRNIIDGAVVNTPKDIYVNVRDEDKFRKCILQEGDLLVNLNFVPLKIGVYKKHCPKGIADSGLAIIRHKNNPYIKSFLTSEVGQNLFTNAAERHRKGVTIPHITLKDLCNIEIPILPLEDLNVVDVGQIVTGSREQRKSVMGQIDSLLESLVVDLFLAQGWNSSDIKLQYATGTMRADMCLFIKGAPALVVEVKSGKRKLEDATKQLKLLCSNAGIRHGLLITETDKVLIDTKSSDSRVLQTLPTPRQLETLL